MKRLAVLVLVTAGCDRKDPPAPPTVIAPGVARTDVSEPGGTHTTITGKDVDLAALPMADWLGLPASGHGSIAVDVHVPTGNVAGASGTLELHCTSKCRLGDDKTTLKPSHKSALVGELQFGHIDFDHVDVKVAIGGGEAKVTEWKVESPDFEMDVKGKLELGKTLSESRIDACVRFRAKPELATRDPKTNAVIEVTGAPKAADGYFNIQLVDQVADMKRLARVCDGTAPPPEPPTPPTATVAIVPAPQLKLEVTKHSETDFDVGIAGLAAIRNDPMGLGKSARIVPAIENGKPVGFKLYGVLPDGAVAQLGLQSGDIVVAVDGRDLSTPDKALEAYTQLAGRTVGQAIILTLRRRGAPLTITYHLR